LKFPCFSEIVAGIGTMVSHGADAFFDQGQSRDPRMTLTKNDMISILGVSLAAGTAAESAEHIIEIIKSTLEAGQRSYDFMLTLSPPDAPADMNATTGMP
jgi:hypothetical protein